MQAKLDVNHTSLQMIDTKGLQSFFGWVRTFVAHFLGKRNLEVYASRLALANINKRPDIRVFAVNCGVYRLPSWIELEKVIGDALDTSEMVTANIIRNLRESSTTLKPELKHTLRLFRDIVEGKEETCELIMHCEAVVMALLKSRQGQPAVASTNPGSNNSESNILVKLSEVLGLSARM